MNNSTPEVGGRLNAFQKVMLQWSSLHPYNAVHVCKLVGPLQHVRLSSAVRRAFQRLGLGVAHLSADGQCYRHETDCDPCVENLDGGECADQCLEELTGRLVNAPFDRPTLRPFRFATVDAGSQAHFLVMAYDHWVADSTSARLLLREVLGEYLHAGQPCEHPPINLYPGTYRKVFRRWLSGPRLAMAAARSVGRWNQNRHAWRAACWSNTEWTVGYRLLQTVPGTAVRLRDFARANGATVQDVFLAALGNALREIMPARGRKHGLALGSIVDTRQLADEELGEAWGAFLSYYLVRTHPESETRLDAATRHIAALTKPIKAGRRYLDSLVNMHCINALWPWFSQCTRQHFLRKALPMSGGISNVVVRDPWMDAERQSILGYHRAVSTGPSLPLVITPTTFGDQLNIGVSYRVAGFSRAKIDVFLDLLRDQLEHPNKASRGELRRRPVENRKQQPLMPVRRELLPRAAISYTVRGNK